MLVGMLELLLLLLVLVLYLALLSLEYDFLVYIFSLYSKQKIKYLKMVKL